MEIKAQKIFFGSNLKFLRERKKINQETLAQKLNITRAKLASLESGYTKAPQPKDYINVSQYFQVSIDSLIKIDLSKLGELKLRELEAGNDIYIKGGNLRILAISVDRKNNEQTEYVPIKAKAGYSDGGYSDPEYIAELPKYSMPHIPSQGTFRIFPISGDSMLPIPSGADITGKFIEDWSTLKADTPAIIILKGEQDFVFKLLTVMEDRKVVLKSLNPSYKPYIAAMDDILEIWKFHAYTSKSMPEAETDLQIVLRQLEDIKKLISI